MCNCGKKTQPRDHYRHGRASARRALNITRRLKRQASSSSTSVRRP